MLDFLNGNEPCLKKVNCNFQDVEIVTVSFDLRLICSSRHGAVTKDTYISPYELNPRTKQLELLYS